jgi:phosphatidylglycerol:prolipoprotein diacylglycerol transferase
MLNYPNIDPILFQLGPLAIRWYGIAYLAGIALAYLYLKNRLMSSLKLSNDDILSFFSAVIFGIIIGGRLGYVFIYDVSNILAHPLSIFAVWNGGMSYHGGAIGAALGAYISHFNLKVSTWKLLDALSIGSTFGLFFGRIANFINGELWGRVTTVPWGMVFPGAGPFYRHPSQLYEAFFEGVVLFLILHIVMKKQWLPGGGVFGLYVGLYGIFRFLLEFFREPDRHIGIVFMGMSMGQLLCILMMIVGVSVLIKRCLFDSLYGVNKI